MKKFGVGFMPGNKSGVKMLDKFKAKTFCIRCNKKRGIIVDKIELDSVKKEELLIGKCEKCGAKVRVVKKI